MICIIVLKGGKERLNKVGKKDIMGGKKDIMGGKEKYNEWERKISWFGKKVIMGGKEKYNGWERYFFWHQSSEPYMNLDIFLNNNCHPK